jgi:hypothetical protein
MAARRGAGCLYRQRNRQAVKAGPWWIKYSVNGVARYESTGTEDKQEAQRLLNERLGRVANGTPMLRRVDKVLYDELAQDLGQHYQVTGDRGQVESGVRFSHLDPYFTGRRVVDITPDVIEGYQRRRQGEQAANGTINRELSILSRMLRLGAQRNKVVKLPVIVRLKEAPPRSGFFEDDQYDWVTRQFTTRPTSRWRSTSPTSTAGECSPRC